jgi:hypothetical protein
MSNQSHNTQAVFDKWRPIRKGAELAAIHVEASQLHHRGQMTLAQYRQRVEGLEDEARREGVEKEYVEALRRQTNPEAAGEAIRLLEQFRKRAAEDLKEAVEQDVWAKQALAQASDTAAQASARRFDVESLIAQLDLAIAGLVRP